MGWQGRPTAGPPWLGSLLGGFGWVGLVWQLVVLATAGAVFLGARAADGWPLLPFVLAVLVLPLGLAWAAAPVIGGGSAVVAVALGLRGERPHLVGLLLAVSLTSTATWLAVTLPVVRDRASATPVRPVPVAHPVPHAIPAPLDDDASRAGPPAP